MGLGEISGYLASVFIVGGFLFKKIEYIRFFNMLGCLCFVLYGFFIDEKTHWAVIIPNGILALLQLYFLIFKKDKE